MNSRPLHFSAPPFGLLSCGGGAKLENQKVSGRGAGLGFHRGSSAKWQKLSAISGVGTSVNGSADPGPLGPFQPRRCPATTALQFWIGLLFLARATASKVNTAQLFKLHDCSKSVGKMNKVVVVRPQPTNAASRLIKSDHTASDQTVVEIRTVDQG